MPFDNPQPLPESETIRILVGAREHLSDQKNWTYASRHNPHAPWQNMNCLLGACDRQIGIGAHSFGDRSIERERPAVIKALHRFARPTARDQEVRLSEDISRMSWRIAMNNDGFGYEHVLGMLDKAIAYERKRAMLGETVGAEA